MKKACLLIGFFLIFTGISRAQTVSVRTGSADLLSAPMSSASNPLLRMPLFYPLEILGSRGAFYHAQDYRDRVGWIAKARVDATKTVVVKVNVANIRRKPGTGSAVILQADRGVAFKVLRKQGNWLEVEHASGKKGWLFESLTWGLKP